MLSIFGLALTRRLAGRHGRKPELKDDYEPATADRPAWPEQNLSRRSWNIRKQAA